ncbi:MAG: hypothetical protein ABEL76_10675, partial [Bradymonadaceae bacterium]
ADVARAATGVALAERVGYQWAAVVNHLELDREAIEDWLDRAVEHHPPPPVDDVMADIQGGEQVSSRPPRFAIYADQPDGIDDNYRSYLENSIREDFELTGTPITFEIRPADAD